MAEKNIKISGIGDVAREDFVRAITDPDKFKEFADQQGWGNKRRQLAWNSLHNYAQGVQNGEINEINDMHQVVDDTGARTNKKEKYNWIGSKFDANGATAAFMNQIAKGMQTATKPADKTLKSIPSVTSYLNQQWFGGNNPDWELFQKNDTLTNGVYGIANRSAKIKEGLAKYKNELTTNGAQYNWDGVDKDALYKNLDAAINSPNVASYAPLGITSDYINNALATRDLSTTVTDTDTNNTQVQQPTEDPTRGFSEEELAQYNTMTPEQQQKYLAQRQQLINLNNEEALTKNQALLDEASKRREDEAFENWLKANGYYSPRAQATSYVSARVQRSSITDSKGNRLSGPAIQQSGKDWDNDWEANHMPKEEWKNFILGDLTSDIHKVHSLNNADRHTTSGIVKIRSKLDWLNYNYQWLLETGQLNELGDDVSSYVKAPKGTLWRLKGSKRSSDGTYMYMRKRGNNLEFYRSKSWNDLRNNEYKKHVSKHQLGGSIAGNQAKLREQYSKDLIARQDAIKKYKIQSQPQQIPLGRSSIKSMGKNTNTLTTADKVAIGAAAVDFLTSFTGNPMASGAGTLLTTGADIASDISHGASFGQVAGNAAMNLGMGLIGFVPGLGTATKAKKLKKILQISSGAIQAYFIANNFNEGIKSLDKVLDGSATVQDYKNLIYGLQGAKGAISSGINTIKRRGAAKVIKELPDKFGAGEARYTFKNKGKETQRLTQAQVKELQKNGSAGASDATKQLLNGVVIKPAKEKFGITWTSRPIEYQYKPKGEIQKLLDDLQIQSQKSSMWNPGRQDYLSMTSEHNWSLPSISIGLGKNSTKEVIKRGKQPPKPSVAGEVPHASPVVSRTSKPNTNQTKPAQNQPTIVNNPERPLQPHTLTPEQQKRDIELLRRRFTSKEPLPIDDATRRAYEDYRKRPMTDQEIRELETQQRAKRLTRASNKDYTTYDQQNAENRAAQNELLTSNKQKQADIARAQQELQIARLKRQQKNYQENTLPEYIRAQANRQFALNWKPEEFKPTLKGAARAKKQAMYERLFPPIDNTKRPNTQRKQSNKKKKTNGSTNIKKHQNGGVLYNYEFLKSVHAFKQGGVIKAQGGVKLNNIWAGKNQDYGYNTYLNRIFGNQDVLAWMRTHYVGDNATKQYADYVMKNVNDRNTYGVNSYNNDSTYTANKGINTFNTGYQNAGNTLNYTLFGNNTKDYTNKKGVAYSLINFTRPNKALATGDSYNIDPSKAYIDNALGLQTYSRVASLTDPGIKTGGFGDWGKYWKEQGNTGAYYYIAPGDTSGKGQWIPTKDKTLNGYQDFEAAPQETSKKDGSVTDPSIGKKSIFDKGKEYLSKLTSNPGNLYNAVETGKYLLANKATNDIFKIKAPNFVISPKHTSYQVMDNLAQQNAYHNRAAETVNQTSRPLTSSGQLQTAAQQESMNNANKLYLQGNIERNTWLEGQKQQSYKAGLYNMESAVDIANANAQQAYKTRMLNEYQDPRDRIRGLATNRQNWINALEKFNVVDPYVERKNAQQQYGLAKAQWDYQNDSDVLIAQQRYQQLLRQHQNDLNFNAYDTDEYRNLVAAQKAAGAKYYNNMYQVYGINNPGFKYNTPTYKKKGGKFEDISKFNTKEFYNTVRHSINTATKQSGDLSKLINTLFKKSNKK